jgi:hypothetical protein
MILSKKILNYLQKLWPFLRLGCISTSVTGLILKCPADALVTRQILSARQMRMAKENALDFSDESTILI